MGRNLIVAATVMLAACTGPAGSLALSLSLPPSGDLRPTGMTQVSLTTEEADGAASVLTTALQMGPNGLSFSAGEVPVGVPITLSVELRDTANRLVGYGTNEVPVTPSANTTQQVSIIVRKPIVYVSSDKPVHTLDPTLDAVDPKYQGSLSSTGAVMIAIDGTQMASISGTTLTLIATADHKPVGSPIAIPGGGATDAAVLPGQRKVVVAAASGLVLVDVDLGTTTPIALSPKPDRVSIGGNAEAGFVAYALQNRASPPTGAATCTGSSSVVMIGLASGNEIAMPIASAMPISDIAAFGDGVYGANPCSGMVTRLDAGAPKIMMALSGAATVAIHDGRLWAAGSFPAITTGNPRGAGIVLGSVMLDGGDPRQVKLPPKTEDVIYDGDVAHELSLQLHADTEIPIDLAILPGAQTVALITRTDTHRDARFDSFGKVIPEMAIIVLDIVLADPQTGALQQRIRASCKLTVIAGSSAEFPTWSCQAATGTEAPSGGELVPTSIGALYGDR